MGSQRDNIPMGQIRQRAGLHSVGSYQVAGTPWLTASAISDSTILTCSFPMVTKTITVHNVGSEDVKVHFADDGLSGISTANYFSIPAPVAGNTLSRFTFDVKCKEFFISADSGASSVEVYAALTGIPTASMKPLFGDGLDG